MDWGQFVKLRDDVLTFDQVRARISALHFNLHYKVLDDFRPPVLNESIYQAKEEDERYYKKMYGIEMGPAGGGAHKAADDDIPLDKILEQKEP